MSDLIGNVAKEQRHKGAEAQRAQPSPFDEGGMRGIYRRGTACRARIKGFREYSGIRSGAPEIIE